MSRRGKALIFCKTNNSLNHHFRYIRTPILPPTVQEYLENKGVGFALVEDCCRAMLLIATDTTINGNLVVIMIMYFSKPKTNLPTGCALGVVSRSHAHEGYMDLNLDDYKPGSLYLDWQKIVLETARILVVSCNAI